MANDENLRRGRVVVQPNGGHIVVGQGNPDNFAAARERDAHIDRRVADDEHSAMILVHQSLTKITVRMLGGIERRAASKPVTTQELNTLKEFRQSLDSVTEARKARGAIEQAAEFFAEMDRRVSGAVAVIGGPPTPVAG